LDTNEVVNAKAGKRKRRAKDSYADQSREVDVRRLEDLTRELFKAHDLNDDGMLEEMELVKLNERIAMLHHGKSAEEIQEVRNTYHNLFRTKLDPEGRPVPYEVFKRYARGVLDELDRDPEAQEMILEQFVAEARAGRDAMDVASLVPEDMPPLDQRLAEIPSARAAPAEGNLPPVSETSLAVDTDAPLVPGTGHANTGSREDDEECVPSQDEGTPPTLASMVLKSNPLSNGQREISGKANMSTLPDGI